MKTRQAARTIPNFLFLFGMAACSSSITPPPTQTATSQNPITTVTIAPSPIPATFTATPSTCIPGSGTIVKDVLPGSIPPQEFLIYLPACYEASGSERFPALYLLHGQTYTQDQWVRMGAPSAADRLINSGESVPFIMVFPDDHYWNLPAGATFGVRLINEIIPYIDKNYRTRASREFRALGGLSRGGGWTLQLGLDHPDLFGSLGLHSPAIFQEHGPFVETIIQNIPAEARPRLWLDIGDNDKELGKGRQLEEILTRTNYLHEFHVFNGDHSELYWSAHVETYLRWYSKIWSEASGE